MATLAADMVRKSLQAFIEGDAELARSVLTMDDAVDAMNRSAYKALTKLMEEQSHVAPQALSALMICRSLERVADHATNIAEDVIFWVQGADVRHHKSVMAKQNAAPRSCCSESGRRGTESSKHKTEGSGGAIVLVQAYGSWH